MTINRILIISVTRIGDTMTSIPAVRAIANHYNNASITFLGHPNRANALKYLPYITKLGYITKKTALIKSIIPGDKYDIAFVFTPERSLLWYASIKSKSVYTLTSKDTYIRKNVTHIHDKSGSIPMHLIDRILQIPKHLGIPITSRKLDYNVQITEEEFANRFCETQLPRKHSPLIAIQSSSFHTKNYRDWPVERFCELCESLLSRYPNSFFILLGSKDDTIRNGIIKNKIGSHALDTSGKLDLRQSAALIRKCNLYIGVDTGPSHIAGALNTPSVVMYHANCPSSLIAPPESDNFIAIEHPLTGTASAVTASMKDITLETVLQESLAMLSRHATNTN